MKSVGADQVHVGGVGQHDLIEDIEREAREFHGLLRDRAELPGLLGVERFRHAAGDAEHRMDSLAGRDGDELAQLAPHGDDASGGLFPTRAITPRMLRSAAGARGPTTKSGPPRK